MAQRIGLDQHAPAGGSRVGATRPVHPCERIEHLEEEDEGGNASALGKCLAAQFHHQRCQDQPVALRVRHQPSHGIRRMHDIGIGEQQVIRRVWQRHRGLDAMTERPEFAGPPRRQSTGSDDPQPFAPTCGAACDFGRAVAAVIVDQDHHPRSAVILPEQRTDALADRNRLVASGYDRGDAREGGGDRGFPTIALAAKPEAAARG